MVSNRPGSQSALRQANAARILQVVRGTGGLTHAEVARRTGLSPASVTNIVRQLSESELVKVADSTKDGRRSRTVTAVVKSGYVLGVDSGRSHVRACLAGFDRTVVAETLHPLPRSCPADHTMKIVRQAYAELIDQSGLSRSQVKAAGVGVPGPLDQASGKIGAHSLLPEWTGFNLRKWFSEELGLPADVENDANLGALGEAQWTPNSPVSALVYVHLATGIGAGMICDGQLYRGAGGTAGEIGHVTIDEYGPLCRCGNRGCLETRASIPGQLELLSTSLGRDIDVPTWIDMATNGHPAAVRLLEDMGHHVGAAMANLCNLMNPAVVALGGPVTIAGPMLLNPIRDEVRRRALPAAYDHVRIEVARHGERSVVFGALQLALALLEQPRHSSRQPSKAH